MWWHQPALKKGLGPVHKFFLSGKEKSLVALKQKMWKFYKNEGEKIINKKNSSKRRRNEICQGKKEEFPLQHS